jgi:AcrR family transcriptional regulator
MPLTVVDPYRSVGLLDGVTEACETLSARVLAGARRQSVGGTTMTVEVQRGYAKGRAKRREIIDQAMAMFGEAGYRGASLREIAARCGISHPGLLHHFPTKESLLLAVLDHRDEVDIEWLETDSADGVTTLRHLVELTALNTTRRGIVELYAVLSAEATSADHPAHAYFRQRYRRAVDTAVSAYARARGTGALREGIDPEAAGRQLIALMDGLQVQWLLDDGATDMAGVLRAHVQDHLTVPL